MEFKAERIGDSVVVKAVVEKKGKDIIIHVPSFKLIKELKIEQYKQEHNGVRNIQ